ncbi:hypothetical protein [Sanguibacter sp. HDW7]|uniref:hypothetical protein n=1 Tax=Sanguibacter sp. HDW7 TaxID=2714931 RepID=UPI0014092FD0|nr:hypothetical protein [Sanguibacter sp. HDW7]QIK83260.1 hypothetical protein G7063_06170 [Sanguibacter sp. HDW7]
MSLPDFTREPVATRVSATALVVLVGTLAVTTVALLARQAGDPIPTLGHGPAVLVASLLVVLLVRTPRGVVRSLALGTVVALVIAGTLVPAVTLRHDTLAVYTALGQVVPDPATGPDGYLVALLASATVIGTAFAASRASVQVAPVRASPTTRTVWLTIAGGLVVLLGIRALFLVLPDGEAVLSTTLGDLHLTRLRLEPWPLVLGVVATVSRAARSGADMRWSVALLVATAFHVGSPTRWGTSVSGPLDKVLYTFGVVNHSVSNGWDGSAVLAALLIVAAGAAMIFAARLDRAPAPLTGDTA